MKNIFKKKNWPEKIGKHFFPEGCPYCGAEIKFLNTVAIYGIDRGEWAYICSRFPECNSYVHAHKETKGDGRQYEPKGRIAGPELREQQEVLRKIFNRIWYQRHIKNLFNKSIVKYREEYYEYLGRQNDIYFLMHIETDDIIKVKSYKEATLKNKAYIWLAELMRMSLAECKIGYFDGGTCLKAVKAIKEECRRNNITI